ncbi:erythromycin esterase family protein [Saccharomonospora sp. NPDC006951]
MKTETGLSAWIRDNGIRFTELDLDAPLDDLDSLTGIVGDARVVALGESSHHVREFYQVRHRILRFLVERHGFTVFALEAPFTEGRVLDEWIHGGAGGEGDVERIATEGIAMSLGDVPELHEVLVWMRSRNEDHDGAGLRCVGTDLPGSLGSPLPALRRIAGYIEAHVPDATGGLARAIALAERFHAPSAVYAGELATYPAMEESDRNELTAVLSELVARLERAADGRCAEGRSAEHSVVAHHLRGAWLLDQLHRSMLTDGIESASTFRDLYLAESVLRLLEADPQARVVLAAHNWHIQKTTELHEGSPLFPSGFHLAAALGEDYRAIGLTARNGRTGVANGAALEGSGEFLFREAPLPPPEDTAIESAFPGDATWTIADLRAVPAAVAGPGTYPRTRMADYFLDQPALSAFDALVCVANTSGTKYTREG